VPVRKEYLAWVLEQLAGVSGLRSRRMFGGVGLYGGERFFGLIDDDVLYLRVDDSNRPEFVAHGCKPFRPFKDKPEYSMSYYDVPVDVLEDVERLVQWARRSIAVAAPATPKAPRKRTSRNARKKTAPRTTPATTARRPKRRPPRRRPRR
jgi:DNA transformation protein